MWKNRLGYLVFAIVFAVLLFFFDHWYLLFVVAGMAVAAPLLTVVVVLLCLVILVVAILQSDYGLGTRCVTGSSSWVDWAVSIAKDDSHGYSQPNRGGDPDYDCSSFVWAALRHAGFDVSEEFYINDHGTQMDNFGRSVSVRYEQLCGRDVPMPENCYGGAYVIDIAREILDADGEKWLDVPEEERVVAFRERSYVEMLEHNKAVLSGFGTTFDTWFSERTLYIPDEDGKSAVDHALEAMDAKGYVFQKDGATWFKSTAFGDEKDRVLIKENGEFTYFLSDVAYHYNKIQRGFTHLIDIWGADHHGYVKRCQAMLAAWGYEGALEVVLGQLVNLFRDGSAVRMSKRTGEMVTFEELIEEVGVDATRYLMLSRSSDQPIDFDIEVAKKKDATNPVYYVQYAHARICSILRKAACEGDLAAAEAGDITFNELAERTVGADVDLSPLCEESELALMRKMGDFADMVAQAAADRAPFRLTHYAQDLAALFHQFYTNCHVLADDEATRRARLALCDASRIVLALTLSLLGVSAPEKM